MRNKEDIIAEILFGFMLISLIIIFTLAII